MINPTHFPTLLGSNAKIDGPNFPHNKNRSFPMSRDKIDTVICQLEMRYVKRIIINRLNRSGSLGRPTVITAAVTAASCGHFGCFAFNQMMNFTIGLYTFSNSAHTARVPVPHTVRVWSPHSTRVMSVSKYITLYMPNYTVQKGKGENETG